MSKKNNILVAASGTGGHIFPALAVSKEVEDEWNIHDFGSYVVASVPGEVVHGDKMRFVLEKKNCNKIGIMFSFLTYKSSETPELQGRKVPIRINGSDTLNVADVVLVRPAFSNMAFFVMFTSPEYYPLDEFTNGIMSDYRKNKDQLLHKSFLDTWAFPQY